MSIVRAGALGGASWLRNEVRRAATCWLVFGPWGTPEPGSAARATCRRITHETRASSKRIAGANERGWDGAARIAPNTRPGETLNKQRCLAGLRRCEAMA